MFDGGSLIIELLEPWNAIYVDNNNIIRWVLRTYRGKDRVISNGLEYKPPPPQGFTRLLMIMKMWPMHCVIMTRWVRQ